MFGLADDKLSAMGRRLPDLRHLIDVEWVKDDDHSAYAVTLRAISDEDLRVLVGTGYFPTPGAAEFLLDALRRRRDAIDRAWLDTPRVSPLDAFAVSSETLSFVDLGVARGLARAERTLYRYRVGRGERRLTAERAVPMGELPARRVDLWTSRDGGRSWGRKVRVTLDGARVVRIER